ncbi:MAG: CPBP family intramembrane metalloprotease [Planctomycetia bacterium]|nr:CPBP family intramembrane metalloprotease [Planctomycetia bacterium]
MTPAADDAAGERASRPGEGDAARGSAARRVAWVDACVVAGASAAYVAAEALGVAKRYTYVAIGAAALVYVAYLVRRRPHTAHDLGFRRDTPRTGVRAVAVGTLGAALALVAWGLARGEAPWDGRVAWLLLLYPPFAAVQQAAFQGLLHRALRVLVGRPWGEVVGTAAAFAAVHVGNAALVGLTFAAGLAWSAAYRRWPNVWLLAASHTVLAALAYPLVLGDAPLARF